MDGARFFVGPREVKWPHLPSENRDSYLDDIVLNRCMCLGKCVHKTITIYATCSWINGFILKVWLCLVGYRTYLFMYALSFNYMSRLGYVLLCVGTCINKRIAASERCSPNSVCPWKGRSCNTMCWKMLNGCNIVIHRLKYFITYSNMGMFKNCIIE